MPAASSIRAAARAVWPGLSQLATGPDPRPAWLTWPRYQRRAVYAGLVLVTFVLVIVTVALVYILYKIPFWILDAVGAGGSGRSMLSGIVKGLIAVKTLGLVDVPVDVLVVVDGCSDDTATEAIKHGAYTCIAPVNRGQGAALSRSTALCWQLWLVPVNGPAQCDP